MMFIMRMINSIKDKSKGQRGFTLIELVVVLAIIALIMLGVVIGISQGRKSGKTQETVSKLRTVETGLYEYKTYKGTLPLLATMGAFPAALNAYIPSDIRSTHQYQCNSTDNKAIIKTPAFSDASEANDVATKLTDQGLCSATSVSAQNEISCTLKTFDGTAKCT